MDKRSNSGVYNRGDHNSGNWNLGNHNSGHCNYNDRNSGNWNSGHHNSGSNNSGHHNSGNNNSGNHNSGHYNSGNNNSGDHNSGNHNSGHYNSGDYNSGFFCTGNATPTFFDQPVDMTWEEARKLIPQIDLPVGSSFVFSSEMTDTEKRENPNHTEEGGYLRVLTKDLKEAFPQAWEQLSDRVKQRFLNLPNFDAKKFYEITGVDVSTDKEFN